MGKYWRFPLLVGLLSLILGACTPDTKIVSRKFDNEGNALYEVLGISPCPINLIRVELNGAKYQDVANNSVVTVPITTQSTSITATAYNNWGKDPTPAEDSFDIPTEEQARVTIENIFAANPGTYTIERDAWTSPGPSKHFRVDYLITTPNQPDRIVNYSSIGDNLNEDLSNKAYLDSLGISNLHLFRVTEPEIKSQLEKFVKNKSNFN